MGIAHRLKTIPLVAVLLALQKTSRKLDGDRADWGVCQVIVSRFRIFFCQSAAMPTTLRAHALNLGGLHADGPPEPNEPL